MDIPEPDYQTENVKLYHGDCFEIAPLLPKPDLLCVDPPYDVDVLSSLGKKNGAFGKRKSLMNTANFTDTGFDVSFLDNFDNWICFCSIKQLPSIIEEGKKKPRHTVLHWLKPNPVPTCNNKYLEDVEYWVHARQPNRVFGDYRQKSKYIEFPCGNSESQHPNCKPIQVMAKAILAASQVNETIADYFMGSGSTGVAALRYGRKFIGIEKEKKWFDEAVERIQREEAQTTFDFD